MTTPGRTPFEVAQDYFIDPHDDMRKASAQTLTDAAETVIRGVAAHETPAGPTIDDTVLSPVASFLAEAYPKGVAGGELAGAPGARYFDHLSVAQLHPAGNMPAILAGVASLLTNNNTIIGEVSGLETAMEDKAKAWLTEHVAGFDPEISSGLLCTGGTLANQHALLAARLKLEEQDRRFRPRQTLASKLLSWTGLVGQTTKSRQAVLFSTSMGHYSLLKNAGILAPGEMIKFEEVPLTPKGYSMDPRKLERRIERARRRGIPILGVVAVAGETETGVVDDLDAIADITEKHGVYLHVDGAYGAPFRMSQEGDRFKGMERAHSVTVDPHKYLYTPYPGGAILFRNALTHARLKRLNRAGGSYMFQDEDSRRGQALAYTQEAYLGERRIEGSMGGLTAAMVYTTIKTLGKEGLTALLDHTLDMTKLFVEEMRDFDGLVTAYEPELNTVCYRPNIKAGLRNLTKSRRKALDERVEAVSDILEKEYKIYLKPTGLPHKNPLLRRFSIKEKVFRVVFTHPYTGQDEVKYIADTLKLEWEGTRE